MASNASNQVVLVTGANRGIGLGLVDSYLKSGSEVIATTRSLDPKAAKGLLDLQSQYKNKLHIEVVEDISSEEAIKTLFERIKHYTTRIDILYNNAGVLKDFKVPFEELSSKLILETLNTNTVAPILVSRYAYPFLKASTHPAVINISSLAGSIAESFEFFSKKPEIVAFFGHAHVYRLSKAALNSFTKSLSAEWPSVLLLTVHPGHVQTDMGGETAPVKVETSVAGIRKVVDGADLKKDTGKFLDYEGRELAW